MTPGTTIVKTRRLGRTIANKLPPIKFKPKDINIGFGPGKLRPDGSRQPQTECKLLADRLMDLNGMSGQLND